MSTRKSLLFSFLDRYASLATSVVTSMVIARLLTPAELGVFSVTMVLLMFLNTIRDMGAGQYLVHEKNLTSERIRAVWTVQLGLGLLLSCMVLLASYPVALFYKEPRMHDIMLIVALNYAINPFGSLTYAWLMREMRFDSLALMRFASGLTGALVSICLAWSNYGPISLAFGSLASTVVNAMVAVFFRPKFFPWLPGVGEIKRVLVFGSKLTASSVVGAVSNSAPELLLGRLQDLTSVGLYSRSNGLVLMFYRLFSDAVGTVCLPWFSKESRDQGRMVEPFLKATAYVTAFGWTFCLTLIFLAHPIVRVLYGNQWDESVELARLLAMAMLFSVPVALCAPALVATGSIASIARATFFSSVQSVVFVAAGASMGLTALGLAMIPSAALGAIIWLSETSKSIGFSCRELWLTLLKSAAVGLLAATGPALALWVYGPYPEFFVMPLMLGCSGGLVGFLLGVMLVNHPLMQEIIPILIKIKKQTA